MESAARSALRAEALLALIEEAPCANAIAALPWFVGRDEDLDKRLIGRLRHAFIGRTLRHVTAGAAAIDIWLQIEQGSDAPRLPQQLVERVVSAVETCRTVGWNQFIRSARLLVNAGKIQQNEAERLDDALGDIREGTSYENDGFNPEGEAAISLPLARTECVRLARALQNKGLAGPNAKRWLKDAPSDPLPEVRFALALEYS